jgi:hypothetical protein
MPRFLRLSQASAPRSLPAPYPECASTSGFNRYSNARVGPDQQ